MSNKPPKVSDLNKGWMNQRRDKGKKIFPEYHLIVCEGEATEPQYFEAIKKLINDKYNGRISLQIEGKAKGTLELLEEAIKEHDKCKNPIRHVWLVYDKDDFKKDSFDNTCNKCRSFKRKGATYHAIWSNECIELWFLLHFSYVNTGVLRTDYINKLNVEYKKLGLGKYAKNSNDTFDKLLPYLNTAIDNAQRLDKIYNEEPPWKRNPCTKVYELLKVLKSYL